MKAKRAIERFVLDLDIDWETFHHRLSETLEGCDHSHTASRGILATMGLSDTESETGHDEIYIVFDAPAAFRDARAWRSACRTAPSLAL